MVTKVSKAFIENATNKNYIINGNFDVWQRGTSFPTFTAYTYTADRWEAIAGNITSGTHSVDRQSFTAGQTDVPNNPNYYLRMTGNSLVTTDAGWSGIEQRVEDVRTFSGSQCTVSFYAKSSTSLTMTVGAYQGFGSGGSAGVYADAAQVSVGTSWSKHTVTFTIPSISGKTVGANSAFFVVLYTSIGSTEAAKYSGSGISGTVDFGSNVCDIAHVQLEEGDVATDFEQRPIGEELTLCQRYYFKTEATHSGAAFFGDVTTGYAYYATFPFPTTMRIVPTVTFPTTSRSGFDAPVPHTVKTDGVYISGTSNATAVRAFWMVQIEADAEL